MPIVVVVRTEPVLKEFFNEATDASPITDAQTGQQILHVAENGKGLAEFREWAYYRVL